MAVSPALLTILALTLILVSPQPTLVSYIVEIEEEEPQDFLQITFSTNAQHQSLTAALEQARNEAENLKRQAEDLCKSLVKDKGSCKEAIEIGKVAIEPEYKQEKRKTLYEQINVEYEVVITWKQIDKFGPFIDKLLTVEGIIIEKVEWQPNEEQQEEPKFLAQGLQKSSALCAELGKKFKRVVSIEEMREEPEQPEEEEPAPEEGEEEEQEEEPQQEQPQQQEQEGTFYRISIECDGDLPPSKKK